jgi:hypothetical protein
MIFQNVGIGWRHHKYHGDQFIFIGEYGYRKGYEKVWPRFKIQDSLFS